MGTLSTNFECNNCNYKFVTGGPSGFRYNKSNKIEYFSLSLRQDQIKYGVDGVFATVYCKNCDEVADIILLEYKTKVYTIQELYSGAVALKKGYTYENYEKIVNGNSRGFYKNYFNSNKKQITESKPEPDKKQVCPKCGKRNMLLLNARAHVEMECPRCNGGIIRVTRIDCFD